MRDEGVLLGTERGQRGSRVSWRGTFQFGGGVFMRTYAIGRISVRNASYMH